jgi:hypothetical protein
MRKFAKVSQQIFARSHTSMQRNDECVHPSIGIAIIENPSEGRHYPRWHLANFVVFSRSPDEVAYELSNSA